MGFAIANFCGVNTATIVNLKLPWNREEIYNMLSRVYTGQLQHH